MMKLLKFVAWGIFITLGFFNAVQAQDFMMQGWYWDYPKTTDGHLWADTLEIKANDLADAGFTHMWLPPLSRASFGSGSNGYEPKDLYDLGEFGGGTTGIGTRSDVDAIISVFNNVGLKAVAGRHQVTWDGLSTQGQLPSGIYVYQLAVNGKIIAQKKLTLLK